MAHALELHVPDLAGTMALGRQLGQALFPSAVIALIGQLGAGKTHLVRAIAEGLGIADSRIVNSPTFVLIQEYQARLPIYHFDAYRLRSPSEFFDLGAHEYFSGDGVCLIEWADRVEQWLPKEHLSITMEITGETSRDVKIEAGGEKYAGLIDILRSNSPGRV